MSNPSTPVTVALACLDPGCSDAAAVLARRLGLELLQLDRDNWQEHQGYLQLLLFDRSGLSLAPAANRRIKPVMADFADPALLHRLRQPGMRRQDLARATGAHEHRGLTIIDATAGWGRDAAILAALGCQVLMVERQPLVAALLEDALQRARCSAHREVLDLVSRLWLRATDAAALLREWSGVAPDVVLLDPMFPERSGSAAVRKEMVLFHALVGADEDAPALLEAALAVAVHRVVVKRPRRAPALAGAKPSYVIEGRSTRFDIYALRGFAGAPLRSTTGGAGFPGISG